MNIRKIFIGLIIICIFVMTGCAAGGSFPNGEDDPSNSPSRPNDFDVLEGAIQGDFQQVMKYTYNDSIYIIQELKDITPFNELTDKNLGDYIYIIKEYVHA